MSLLFLDQIIIIYLGDKIGKFLRTWNIWTSLVAQKVKNLPAMRQTQFLSLGWENPLQKGMATHSSVLAWRITWTEESGGQQSMDLQRVGQNRVTNTFTFKRGVCPS